MAVFDKRLLCTGISLILTAVLTVAVWRLPERSAVEAPHEFLTGFSEGQIAPTPPAARDTAEEEQPYAYILREYEGRIAVFVPDAPEPQIIFDVLVKFLPDYDRIQMKQGIPVADYNTLSAIIEDYIS